MKKIVYILIASIGMLVLFSGCHGTRQPQWKVSGKRIAIPKKEFVVYGEGIAPKNTISPAQAIALAKRAAITDAYRQLSEKIYGIRVNARETVKDAALKDSRIVTQVNGLVKNATITDTKYKDGLYTVRMELTMSGDRWKEIFSY